MGVNREIIKLSTLAENDSLRLVYSKEKQKTKHSLVKFLNCIKFVESGKRPKGGIIYLENEKYALSLGGEQINVDGSIDLSKTPLIPLSFYEKTTKGRVLNGDILICKDGALTGKACIINDDFPIKHVMVNEHVYIIRGNGMIHQKILFYLVRSNFVQSQIKDLAYHKKGQPGLNQDHLKKINLPKLNPESQERLLGLIEPIENSINNLKKKKRSITEIINKVFTKELGFNWNEFDKLKSQKITSFSLNGFSNNLDCRFSYKFHNKAGKYLYDFLCSKTNKRVKDFISEPIVLGKSVSPADYDEKGEYYYIAMANIKNWEFDPNGCKTLSKKFSLANMNKTVQENDIILARSGEGTIGKVALIEKEKVNAIFADFTQRIRLHNYNQRLAYYFFRSDFFQYLVYTHKKGLGNNTNIFPGQIGEFPLLDWTEIKQIEIADKIKSQIDAQNEIDKEIEEKQCEITKLIDKSL